MGEFILLDSDSSIYIDKENLYINNTHKFI